MSTMKPVQVSPTSSLLPLKFPQSVAVFDNYEDAQKAVDHLSDHEFPVENLCIVGTDLKLVERVLGRRSWGQVLAGGAVSGIGTGLLLGLAWMLFIPGIGTGTALFSGIVLGVAMGVLSSAMAHRATGGRRDFSSVTATVATRYEVLGEHQVVARAREMLQDMPGFRAMQLRSASAAPVASPTPGASAAGTAAPVRTTAPAPTAAGGAHTPEEAWGRPTQATSTQPTGTQPAGAWPQVPRPAPPQPSVRPEADRTPQQAEPEPIYSPWPVHPSTDNQFRDENGTAAD